MATISSPGVGSTLDVTTIVSKLMTAEQGPMNQLQAQETSYTAKLSAFGALKGALSTLQQAAQTLNLSSTFSSVKSSVADSSVMSASVSGVASAGTYNVEVQSLAQAQKLVSSGFASSTDAIGTGTLTIAIGSYSDASQPPVSFTAKSDTTPVALTIDSSNNTLEGIRDAINNARAGVTATIINDGSNYRLSLTSTATGLANAMQITASEGDVPGLAQLAYDGTDTTGVTQNQAAADAVIKVDGITITKPGNTITDAIQGVTLNLAKQTDAGVTTRLTLTPDTDRIASAIDSFVSAYNTVNKQIADATAYDSATGKGSVLTGDATASSLQVQLRSALSNVVAGGQSNLRTLSDIGVAFQTDGSLKVDTDKRSKILADPNADVKSLFISSTDGASTGVATRLNTLVSSMIFGSEATLNSRVDGITSSIKDLDKRRADEAARLSGVEARYTKQFSALDTMIASMTTTSTYLTQQLAALPKIN